MDDDHDDILLISEAFEKYTDHLRVVHAYNGYEGVMTLQKMNEKGSLPCLIILDINMPVMNGKEALKKIRADRNYDDIPVIMFSTSNNLADKRYAEGLNADFITKPLSYNDMRALVDEFVSRCNIKAINDVR